MHAFLQENFVGPELLSKVISRRHFYSDCDYKLGTEKTHDNTHCYTITNKKASTRLYRCNNIFISVPTNFLLVALPQVSLHRFARA